MNFFNHSNNIRIGNYIYLILSFGLVLFAVLMPANSYGDGLYYYSTLISLATDGWPAINEFSRQQILSRFNFDIYQGLSSQGTDGSYYTWHFWFYSLINLPSYYFLKLFNLDTLKSFQLKNSILIVGTVYYLLKQSKISPITKTFVISIYLISSSTPYFLWSHPEIFSASLLLIACFSFINDRIKTTVLLTAFASLNNPSISFFLIPIYFYYFHNLKFNEKKSVSEIIYQFIPIVTISLLILIPYLWSFFIFEAFNPIVKHGYIDYSLISLGRLHSFFFDLNQGVVVSALPLITSFFIYFVYRLINKIKLNKYDLLLISLLLIIIPTLAQINWNPGQGVSLRYIAWAIMPLLAWLAMQLEEHKNKLIVLVLAFFVILQAFFAFFVYGGVLAYKAPLHIEHKSWVKKVLNSYPQFYNPIPEIFYERTLGEEGVPDHPVKYYNKQGELTKILIKNDLDYSQYICDNNKIFNEELSNYKIVELEQNYIYLNGKFICQ